MVFLHKDGSILRNMVVCLFSFIYSPLHAARKAMAAAGFCTRPFPVPNHTGPAYCRRPRELPPPALAGPNVGWHPEGHDIVVPALYARADFDCCFGQALVWVDGIRPDLVDGRSRVSENGVAAAVLLPPIKRSSVY